MNLKVVSGLVAMCVVFLGGLVFRPEVAPAPATSTVSSINVHEVTMDRLLPLESEEELVVAENATEEIPAPSPTPASSTTSAPSALAPELVTAGWAARVGDGRGVWVSVASQRMSVLDGGKTVWSETCATAANGVGSESGSQKTPLGWHVVAEKMGEGAPWGQVFRSRAATKQVWKPGMSTKEDLVLTRLLWLDGLEPGKNKGKNAAGKNVDSKERCIYIHGTNAEELLGTPSSHGCVRLSNDDVIAVFDLLPVGTPVLITE